MFRFQIVAFMALMIYMPGTAIADGYYVRPAGYVSGSCVCYPVVVVVPCSPVTRQPTRGSAALPAAAKVYAKPTSAPPSDRTARAELPPAAAPLVKETAEPPSAPAPTGRTTFEPAPAPAPAVEPRPGPAVSES